MNVIMEQGEPFWLDFEHGVSEWQTSEAEEHTSCDEENIMISFSNDDLELENAKERKSKAGLKIKCTSKYLTKVNPKFPLDGSTQIKIPMANKPVKPDLLQEAFRIEMLAT